MGLFSAIFGGKKNTTTNNRETFDSTRTGTSTTQLPDYITGRVPSYLDQVDFLTSGLIPETAPTTTVAPFNQDQLDMFDMVRGFTGNTADLSGVISGYGDLAAKGPYTLGAGPGAISASTIDPQSISGRRALDFMGDYESKYTGDVVDAALSDLNAQRGQTQVRSNLSAAAGGAYGGSRHGIRDAQVEDDYLRNVASTTANLRDRAFTQALGAGQADAGRIQGADMFNADASLRASTANAGNKLVADSFNANLADSRERYNAGAGERADAATLAALTGQGRAILDQGNVDFMNETTGIGLRDEIGRQIQDNDQAKLDEPWEAMQFRLASLGLVPYPTTTVTSDTASGSGTFSGNSSTTDRDSIFKILTSFLPKP